ncbi:MAG TPA: hypothetical protein VMG40_02125 [Bryobacteraceae bacterium]|jgi:hypothetical protein|nr:hypothetical protein [Bryobacteraceae bacterium]
MPRVGRAFFGETLLTGDKHVEVSLAMLDALHDRWVRLMSSLDEQRWRRSFRHPEIGPVTLEQNLALYAHYRSAGAQRLVTPCNGADVRLQ